MENLTMELYVSPIKEKNEEKYGTNDNQCICCGKPMKNGLVDAVLMNESWDAVNPSFVNGDNCFELTGSYPQGVFFLGADCAKKMKGFTFKYELK
jgi:hypothetical protein